MKAWKLSGPKHLERIEIPIPTPGKGEVLAKIQLVGICGTDVEFYLDRYNPEKLPDHRILGHEPVAVVEAIGEGVPSHLLGKRVTFRYTYGCFAEYTCTHWENLFVLPDDINDADGTLVEVLPSVLSAINRAELEGSTSVLVIGQGTSGLLLTKAASMQMPRKIVAADTLPERETLSLSQGATEFMTVPEGKLDNILEQHGLFSVVILACYDEKLVDQALHLVERRGRLVLYGGIGPAKVDLYTAHKRRVDIVTTGVDTPLHERYLYNQAVELFRSGHLDGDALHTQTYPLDELDKAFTLRSTPRKDVVHVLVEISHSSDDDPQKQS